VRRLSQQLADVRRKHREEVAESDALWRPDAVNCSASAARVIVTVTASVPDQRHERA
jgi:hypothetical protein